ncbi:MAG: hypothetical protein CM15mP74_31550 [Halieaceae bacterium]|nr:MAG: hypothetical protein CM15mP74_31550 [Halieaceae bacterium]
MINTPGGATILEMLPLRGSGQSASSQRCERQAETNRHQCRVLGVWQGCTGGLERATAVLESLATPQLQGAFLEVISRRLNQSYCKCVGPARDGATHGDSSQKRAFDSNDYAPAAGLNVGSLMLYGRLQSDSTQRIPRQRRSTGRGNLSGRVASKSKERPGAICRRIRGTGPALSFVSALKP